MSKASDWALEYERREKILSPMFTVGENYKFTARVNGKGHLDLTDARMMLDREQALAFAKWIQETFT